MPTENYGTTLSDDRWLFGGTLIATKEFAGGKHALHANLGYEHHTYRTDEVKDSTRSGFWSGSIAGETEISQGLFAVADFGLATTADKSISEPSVYALTGVRYEINDYLDANTGIKFGLSKAEDDFTALYGIVLKF